MSDPSARAASVADVNAGYAHNSMMFFRKYFV